jgi:hypothetical protein
VIEERGASNQLIASYVHDDAGNVLEQRGALSAATSYYLHDAQLSVRQIATGGGAISDAYDPVALTDPLSQLANPLARPFARR